MLLNPILINIIGFISPFWGIFVLNDGTRGLELLHIFQPYAPFVSVIYAYALYILSKIDNRTWIRAVCLIISIIYVGTSIYGFLPEEEMIFTFIININYSMETIMLFIAGVIILYKSNELQESLLPSNAV